MEPTQPAPPLGNQPNDPGFTPPPSVPQPPLVPQGLPPTPTPLNTPVVPPSQPSPIGGPTVSHQVFGAVPRAEIPTNQPQSGPFVSSSGGDLSPIVSAPKKKRFVKLFILPIAILLILGGGSAAAYFFYYLPNQPQNIILTAFINMVSQNKLHSTSFTDKSSVSVSSSQAVDESLTGSIGQGGKFDVKLSVDAYLTTITAEALSPDGNSVYFKLGGLDGVGQILNSIGAGSSAISGYSSLINSVNNQWYQINASLVSEFKQNLGLNNVSSLSSSDANKLESIYQKNAFLTVKKTLPSQTISGMSSYHYQVAIDNQKLQSFVNAAASAHISGFKLEQSELKDIDSSIGSTKTANHPFDIWVSKSDKFIDQLALSGKSGSLPYSTTFTFTQFNQPVTIQTPANAKSILDLISQISSQFSGTTGTSPLDLLTTPSTSTPSLPSVPNAQSL